ncbi:VWA domain-containing protein [Myxococcota bacterium]|nr:VWA domain-containing protein [Myxococcota bacterium]
MFSAGIHCRITASLVISLLCTGVAAAKPLPEVTRPTLVVEGKRQQSGLAFFLRTENAGVVAIGTAHSFDLADLASAGAVTFEPVTGGPSLARAGKLAAPPGLAFNAPGGSIDQDFLVYALDPPEPQARIFTADSQHRLAVGEQVRIVGGGDSGELAMSGLVAESQQGRIEVELLGEPELRGWGGAPIVSERSGQVVGILQATRRARGAEWVVGTPIRSILRVLDTPLAGGAGQPLEEFGELATLRVPSPSPSARATDTKLLDQAPERAGVRIRVDYPPNGAIIAHSPCGTFVSGRASSRQGDLRRFDVVFVLDVSGSTFDATGVDINANGIVGKNMNSPGGVFSAEHSDPGDSILAAEVAAAREILRQLDPRSTRVALVTFSSTSSSIGMLRNFANTRRHAETIKPLTRSHEQIESALDDLLESTPVGETHIAAGLDQATIELLGLRGSLSREDSKSEKIVFFFTDGQPTLPYGPEQMGRNVAETIAAADRARRGNVTVHTFAIGPEALAGPIATIEMANRTGGTFTPVRHPGELVEVVDAVEWPSLRAVHVRDTESGRSARYLEVDEDGVFSALVETKPGQNDVEIRAGADDGTQTRVTLSVRVADGVAPTPIPERLAPRRNLLLERCLEDIRNRRLTREREMEESVRRELLLEIERERARARDRAAEQRRRLELEVER